jgi:hypothetical protein
MRLELGNLARDRRDRDAHPLGGASEAAGLDHARESGDRVETVHSLLLHFSQ